MLIIGVTGNIACGKSTVDGMLLEAGATVVIDADRIVHDLQQTDPAVRAAIVAAFGPMVQSSPKGGIDRKALGSVVFNNPQALQRLEAIMHPAVRRAVREQLTGLPADAVVVLDAVKLLQGDLATLVQSVWWVSATREQQLQRLRDRGLDTAAAQARLAVQPKLTGLQDRVDVMIDNSGSLADTRRQVFEAYKQVLAAHRDESGR